MTRESLEAACADAYQCVVYEVARLREQRARVRSAQRVWRAWRDQLRAAKRAEETT